MRVGYSCQLLHAHNFGVGVCILNLARALIETGGDDQLVLYAHDAPLDVATAGARRAAVEVARSSALTRWRLPRVLWEQIALPLHAARDRLDVLHCPGYVRPLVARRPVVISVYDLLALTRPAFCTTANRWHYRLILPTSIRRADRILVPSRAVAEVVEERFPEARGRIELVAPGIDERFRLPPSPARLDAMRVRYALPARFALFVGNAEPKKNLARLVDAFSAARKEGAIDGELILAGGEGWGRVLAGREHVAGVRRIGYVPEEDLPMLYRLARVFVFPSLAEGFGLPVLEAMVSGTPVVSSGVPALLDADPHAAVRIDPLAIDDIAAGLARAWNDENLRRALGERGVRAAARFSWRTAALRTWEIYREVSSAATRAPAVLTAESSSG